MSIRTPYEAGKKRLGLVIGFLGLASAFSSPISAANHQVLKAKERLESRVLAARELLQQQGRAANDNRDNFSGKLAQWFNWPNWGNWGNWPNWNNWGNWWNG